MPFGLQGRSALQDQMGQWAQQPLVAQAPAMDVPAPQIAPPKPGFFGQGGVGRNIIGSLGDALMAIGHLQPTYGPAMQAERERAAQLADEQRKVSQAALQPREVGGSIVQMDPTTGQYKTLYTAPQKDAQPYRFEDNAGNVWQIGATGQPERVFTDTVPKFYVQGDQAIQIPNPWAGRGASAAPPPTAAIQHLQQNPALKADFDAKYGPGAADRYLTGGGGGNVTGGFPR